MEVDDPVMKKLAHTVLHGDGSKEDESIDKEQEIDILMQKRSKGKLTNAQVFCVGCGAKNRTLHKWHNSYLCVDCFKIAQNVGDEKFIKALKGEG